MRGTPTSGDCTSVLRTSIRPLTRKAWLQGHQFDLEDLAQLFATGDVRVVRDTDEDAYYLTAPGIDNPPEGTAFYELAASLLVHVNGLGRVNKADLPVQLTGKYSTPTGPPHRVIAATSIDGRLRVQVAAVVIGPDAKPGPDPPSPWPDRLARAETNPTVAKVLQIMAQG